MINTDTIRFCLHKSGLAKLIIFEPRYHDKRVLIAVRKVKDFNVIKFSKAPSREGLWYISGKNVRKYPKASNGSILCFVVPLDELKPFEWQEKCEHSY